MSEEFGSSNELVKFNPQGEAEGKSEEYQKMLDMGGSFNQSLFSEEHFVLNDQITPHRKLRQALLHYDGKAHAMAEATAGSAKSLAMLNKAEGDLKILERLQKRVSTVDKKPYDLPGYSCEVVEHETVRHLVFDAKQILSVYEDTEWDDCQAHLLRELDGLITMKRAEVASIKRGQFQQQKLVRDAHKEIAFYEKIIPKLKKLVEESGLTAEEAEEQYWTLRNKRFIETKQLEQITGIPQDYWQSISNLKDSQASHLIEFAKDTKHLLETEGVPPDFRFKKHARDYEALIAAPHNKEAKLLAAKGNAERNNQGNIVLGLLFRNQEEADRKGACDPDGMLFHPRGYNVKPVYVWGMRTDEARNFVVQKSLEAGADWVFFVDDDVILPKNALQVLLETATKNDYKVIGGEYPLKINPYQSASVIYTEDGKSVAPDVSSGGIIDINGILPTGCMLVSCALLREMGGNWFQEYRKRLAPGVEEMLRTDDYPFTQRCVEMGIIPKMHTGVKCQHVDFKRRVVYGEKTEGVEYCINNRANPFTRAGGVRPTPRVALACPIRSLNDQPIWDRSLLNTVKGFEIATQTIMPMGLDVDAAYTEIVRTAISNGVDYLIFIESDMIVPKNVISQLLHRVHDEKLPFVCGSYVLKDTTGQSAAICVDVQGMPCSFPKPFEERGVVANDWVVPFGCAVINTRVFADIPFPWFKTVFGSIEQPVRVQFQGKEMEIKNTLTQDAFFCERLFMAGYNAYIDTDLQCVHVDRSTGRVFGTPVFVNNHALKMSDAWRLAVSEETLKDLKTV